MPVHKSRLDLIQRISYHSNNKWFPSTFVNLNWIVCLFFHLREYSWDRQSNWVIDGSHSGLSVNFQMKFYTALPDKLKEAYSRTHFSCKLVYAYHSSSRSSKSWNTSRSHIRVADTWHFHEPSRLVTFGDCADIDRVETIVGYMFCHLMGKAQLGSSCSCDVGRASQI